MNCTDIAAGLTAAVCGQAPVPNSFGDVIIGNWEDIDKANCTVANNIISEIVLKADKLAYVFNTFEDSVGGVATFNKGTYFNTFQHDVMLRVFTKTELAKAFVNNAMYARVFVILRNKDIDTGKVKYELYGWDAGLEMTAAVADISMPDSVVYDMTFGSSDNAKEGSLPKSIYVTSEAATDAMVEALHTVTP